MKKIDVAVSPDAEEFYLAFSKGWTKVAGHSISVGDFRFCATPIKDVIRISEVQSGAKLFDHPMPEEVQGYGETMFFLGTSVASRIVMLIEKVGIKKVEEQIAVMKAEAFNKFGPKPTARKIDVDWIKEDISDVLH